MNCCKREKNGYEIIWKEVKTNPNYLKRAEFLPKRRKDGKLNGKGEG